MKEPSAIYIKFKNGDLHELRERLLTDLTKESFGVLLGKTDEIETLTIIKVVDFRPAYRTDYISRSIAFLSLEKQYIYDLLVEVTERLDVDTIIDVHTHPFCEDRVSFSGTDDSDERAFHEFLIQRFDGLHYASIVFSRKQYAARFWEIKNGKSYWRPAVIRAQTAQEQVRGSYIDDQNRLKDDEEQKLFTESNSVFNRSVLALGLDTMRRVVNDEVITVVGSGGLGSVVAEHLVHMGFHEINLIDPDVLEISNLNRIVGAYYNDAKEGIKKVEAIKKHLDHINPRATIRAFDYDVLDGKAEIIIAQSTWVIVTSDSHSSRYAVQRLCLKYFVPFISVGVNIEVQDEKIKDMSGEVITIRLGDNMCLNCLQRVNYAKIASETHQDPNIRMQLIQRGYVAGQDIKEPAVKTVNSILASMAVDVLVNQYTHQHNHYPILVYEYNKDMSIYKDTDSVNRRFKNCYCNI